jgi:hypothetical protein
MCQPAAARWAAVAFRFRSNDLVCPVFHSSVSRTFPVSHAMQKTPLGIIHAG